MKTTILQHSFFPTGKGLVIIDQEIILLYAIDGQYTIVYTDEPPAELDKVKTFLDQLHEHPKQAMSHTGTLQTILNDIPDTVLGGIYEAIVGYNPFTEDQDSTANRNLVCECLTMPETLKEVFNA